MAISSRACCTVYFILLCNRLFSLYNCNIYVSGISFYHKIHNFEDPTAVFIVKKLLEGFRRTGQRRDVRAPVTEAILQKVCSVLPDICFSTYESCLFKAAYLVAYFGLLRVSEIVFTNQINANRPLLYSDVQVTDGSQAVLISIRVSKTNQSGAPTILRIPRSGNPSLASSAMSFSVFL